MGHHPVRPGSGLTCDQDAAGFDGWYSDREDALAVFNDWRRRLPYWIVALVQQDLTWFGDGDFHAVRGHPLTAREAKFDLGRALTDEEDMRLLGER
jgi:hypothetical protein